MQGFPPSNFLCSISVIGARSSRVVHRSGLFNDSDISEINEIRQIVTSSESLLDNNPQNKFHQCKVCTFLNNPPSFILRSLKPGILKKMIQFGLDAWQTENWSGDEKNKGPLYDIYMAGGMSSLSIRVIEYWDYSIGSGLIDPLHYDVDSVITIVVLLYDEYEGGVFRTNEVDDVQLEHSMVAGDAICFISHKYHNITPVTQGHRKSLVMELWQGGIGHLGRL